MTVFEKFKENLTIEQLVQLSVKVVILNGSEAYYMTTQGQLFPMTAEGHKAAVELELAFWNKDVEEKTA